MHTTAPPARCRAVALAAVALALLHWHHGMPVAAHDGPHSPLYRVNAGGPVLAGTPNWSEDSKNSPSPFVNAAAAKADVHSTPLAIDVSHPSIPAGTPAALFQTERWDRPDAEEMQWSFPVTPGTYEVRLYFAEIYFGEAGRRIFDVTIEDALVLSQYDIVADAGVRKGVVKTFTVTADGTLDILFGHVLQNPKVSAIEILDAASQSGQLGASPGSLDHGTILVGQNNQRAVQITNLGAAGDPSIMLLDTSITGTDAGQFADDFDDAGTVTLAPGASTTLTVTFAPTSTGVKTASLAIAHSGNNNPVTIPLSGSGTSALPGTWQPRAPSGVLRQEVSYVQVNGKFYLAGGGTVHEVYNPATNSWSTLAPLPINVDHIQAVTVGGLIYYIGGVQSSTISNAVHIYNPATNSFSQGAAMPRPRGAGGVAVYNGKIYYAGGLSAPGTAVNWFDVYDPAANTWAALPNMPVARDHFHAAVVNGRFYVTAGRQGSIDSTITSTMAYDFGTGTWQGSGLAPIPTARGGVGAAVIGTEIFVIGGEGGGSTFDAVEAYDTATNAWRMLAPMPTARHGIQAAVCSGGIYIAAGGLTQGNSNSTNIHEVLFPGTVGACSVAASPSDLGASPTPVGFGAVLVGQNSQRALQLTNLGPAGSADIVIDATTITGTHASQFNDNFNDAGSVTLAPGASTTLTVTFAPTSTGAKTANLAIMHSGSNNPLTVPLSGSGTSAVPGTWQTRAPSGVLRQEVSYVHLNGKFYLAGGTTVHEVYDPATDTWARIAPLPADVDHVQAVTFGGRIYYIGGSLRPGVSAAVYIYDPATDSFTQGAPMPRPRGAGGVAVYNNKIYYAGGVTVGAVVAWFDVYDPVGNTWSALPDMPVARDHFHAAVVNGRFYVTAGRQGAINSTITSTIAYDFATGTWQGGLAPIPTARGGVGAAAIGTEIFIIGGEGGGSAFNTVEAYDTATNTWRTLPPMPTARHGIQAALCNDGIYIAAGGMTQGNDNPTTAHEVFFPGAVTICDGSSPSGSLGASPPTSSFGVTPVGQGSQRLVQLTNLGAPGSPSVNVTSTAIAGAHPGQFSDDFNDAVTVTLAPGQSTTITVSFLPTSTGAKSAELRITHSGTNSPLAVPLSGTGSTPTTIGFGKSPLAGATSLATPTTLQFGPDGRLYVGQVNGIIRIYSVSRTAANTYAVTATETITSIQSVPNRNDNGQLNPSVNTRQVTGILVVGTAANPVIYVTHSDPRIGGNNSGIDLNLDTNSSMVSRLTWTGTAWQKLDLVRGLPRSEENHSANGMVFDAARNILYVAMGGNTNKGATSNNFALLPEFALSAAILSVDLGAIGNTTYDLPTLDDESRPGDPDANDPFGGNNGKNQARLVPGGPVQVYAPGFRNPYDVVITQSGRMYTIDNGGNGGWGDVPIGEGPQGVCTNGVNEPGTTSRDTLHLITGPGYYGGHPNPTRGNMANTFNATNPQSPVTVANAVECDYREANGLANGALAAFAGSTNGLTEYTADNFGGALRGDLLAAAWDNVVFRLDMNTSGTATTVSTLFATVGTRPLDIQALGPSDPFPGTVWVADFLGTIFVFEPNDYEATGSQCTGADDPALDEDQDGFSNADELDNGTNPCSAADVPTDWDGDFTSDLNDPDDDNDGVVDVMDRFALDPLNGTGTSLPVSYQWENDGTNPGGILNLGFTGLMTNGSANYSSLYDPTKMTAGGAAGALTVDEASEGDAFGSLNTQEYGFQFGLAAGPAGTDVFVVQTRVLAPFSGLTAQSGQEMGLFVGTGDQDNYAKLVVSGAAGGGVTFLSEEAGAVGAPISAQIPLPGPNFIDLYLRVDPDRATVQPFYRVTSGGVPGPQIRLAAAQPVSANWFTNSLSGLAIGILSTSRGPAPVFPATWDFIQALPATAPATLGASPGALGFGTVLVGDTASLTVELTHTGGADSPDIVIDSTSITGTNANQYNDDFDDAGDISLAPGDTTTVTVTFAPTASGAKSATLAIAHSGAGAPLLINLAGSGATPGSPTLAASPTILDFGTITVGQAGQLGVQLTNAGTTAITIGSTQIAGAHAAQFADDFDDAVGVTLAAGAFTTVQVTFAPDSAGGKTATLDVVHSGSNSPLQIPLTGAGSNPTGSAPYFLELDGVDDFLSVADHDDLSFTTGVGDLPFTIEAWIRPDDVGRFDIVAKWSGGQEYRFQVIGGNVRLEFRDGASGALSHATSTSSLTWVAGTWYHIAATYDGRGGANAASGVSLYRDGQLLEAGANSSSYVSMKNGVGNVVIGRVGPRHADGAVDEIRIWNDARTSAEIQANKDTELGDGTLGMIAYWKLNEGSGDTAADSSGRGHDAAAHNGPAWMQGGPVPPP